MTDPSFIPDLPGYSRSLTVLPVSQDARPLSRSAANPETHLCGGTVTVTYGNESHFPPASEAASLPADAPFPDLNPKSPLPVLVRATNAKSKKRRGSKVKLATEVDPGELDAFYARYADVCKLGMVPSLKPRDRSKKKAKARKNKKTATKETTGAA